MARNRHQPGPKHHARKESSITCCTEMMDEHTRTANNISTTCRETGSWFKNYELRNDLTRVSEHSATCTGVCHIVEEVRREGLASVLLTKFDKCDKKFYLETSTK